MGSAPNVTRHPPGVGRGMGRADGAAWSMVISRSLALSLSPFSLTARAGRQRACTPGHACTPACMCAPPPPPNHARPNRIHCLTACLAVLYLGLGYTGDEDAMRMVCFTERGASEKEKEKKRKGRGHGSSRSGHLIGPAAAAAAASPPLLLLLYYSPRQTALVLDPWIGNKSAQTASPLQ